MPKRGTPAKIEQIVFSSGFYERGGGGGDGVRLRLWLLQASNLKMETGCLSGWVLKPKTLVTHKTVQPICGSPTEKGMPTLQIVSKWLIMHDPLTVKRPLLTKENNSPSETSDSKVGMPLTQCNCRRSPSVSEARELHLLKEMAKHKLDLILVSSNSRSASMKQMQNRTACQPKTVL